ncbi:MAG TPA: H-NS histone family protein [Sedimentisphaerales bacterium]
MQKPSLPDLNLMSVDELWHIHEEIGKILLEKITSEKQELERRLLQLNPDKAVPAGATGRRKYPAVVPKYCNPASPSETWSGRGKQPRWLVAQLRSGHKIEEFAISQAKPAKEFAISPMEPAKRVAGRVRP